MDQVKNRSLLSLSWPLILTFAISMFQPMMDSWFLSRTSQNAAAGVGALLPVLGALFMVIQAFSQAGASIASQYLGGNQGGYARTTQSTILFGSILFGLVLTGAILPLSKTITSWIGLRGAPEEYAEQFLWIVALGFVFRATMTTLTALIATHGYTLWNFFGNAITIGINIILNIVFLNGLFGFPKMGVKGVALATIISWFVSSVILWCVLRFKIHHKTRFHDIKRSKLILPSWLRIGVPAAIEPVSFQLFQIFITAMVVHLGMLATTSRVFSANFAMTATILSVGLGSGNQILIAHLVGAHDFEKANKRMHQSLVISSIGSFLIAIAVALNGPFLMSFYTQDPEIIHLGAMCLWCDVLVQPFKGANIIITNSLRASGDSKFPAVVGSLMMWTLGISCVLFLGMGLKLGLIGLWLGMACDEFFRSIVNYNRWRRGQWKSRGIVK